MGAIVPVAFQALQVLQAVNTVAKVINNNKNNERQNRLALEQLQSRQTLEENSAAQKTALDKQELAVKAAQAEEERRLALKRAVARQRASFGASGIGSSGGSSEAVLLGLFDEFEDQKASRERLDNIRLTAFDQSLNDVRRVNTLERTQAAERARINNNASSFDVVSDLLSIF